MGWVYPMIQYPLIDMIFLFLMHPSATRKLHGKSLSPCVFDAGPQKKLCHAMPPKNGIAKKGRELNGQARLVSSAAFNALLRGLLSRSGFEEARSHKGTDGMELLKFGAVSKLDKNLGFHIYIDTHTIYIHTYTTHILICKSICICICTCTCICI